MEKEYEIKSWRKNHDKPIDFGAVFDFIPDDETEERRVRNQTYVEDPENGIFFVYSGLSYGIV